jgi:hypothetical protein
VQEEGGDREEDRRDDLADGAQLVHLALEKLVRHLLVTDFGALQPAADHAGRLPNAWFDPDPDGGGSYIASPHAPEFAEQFAVWLATAPQGIVVELGPELRAFAEAPTRGQFALEIEESGIDWFDVRVSLRVEDTTLTPAEIALLRKARGRFIRLAGRGWRRLEILDDKATGERLERLGLETATLADDTGREAQKFHALQLADEALGEAMPEQLARQIRERAAKIRALPAPPVPEGFHGELRPYQVEGFHFLAHLSANHFGGVLADDMGLGKTLEALAWLLWIAEGAAKKGRGLRALVVCPKSVVFNWESETARFAPSLETGRISPRAARPRPKEPQIVVV